MNQRTLATSIGAVSSGLLVVLGVYLPWIRVEPGLPASTPIPAILIAGMNHGFETTGGLVLVLLGIGLIVSVLLNSVRKIAMVLFTVGVFTVAISLQNLLGGGYILGVFVPALGVYVTLIGGVGLLLSSGFGYAYARGPGDGLWRESDGV